MSKIAVIIDDLFEDIEYTEPAKAFKEAKHELVHIGLEAGKIVMGKRNQVPVKINQSVREARITDFDALFIPGGYSPDRLRTDENAVRFTRHFVESGKAVFTICHAPQLLITADVLKNRKITGWKSIIQDIKNAGAEFVDKEVVEDENLISSRGPQDIQAFITTCLNKLKRMGR